jgi:alpha-glucosidase
VKDLSNTYWCNFTFFNDKVRQSASLGLDAPRPLIYHRWGGLGSHRYQLGFSGDTYEDWNVLAFLPWFTATSSNVGYGYWGHDIGGHQQHGGNKHRTDPELFTRWIQYGVFTPIFKTHSTQNANLDRRIWAYPEHYPYMKAAIELRYALTPYIYDAARETYDTGVSLCRPLYYEYPEEEKAYTWKEEFFFGDKILATALCQPMDKASGKTDRKMWFPAGSDWYDMAHHKMMKGGSIQTLYYTIDENPWYVKAGSIIPLAAEGIQNLQDPTDAWRILVIPGNGKSSYERYEDDGTSQNYVNDYATTLLTKEASLSRIRVHVAPRKGTYKGAPATRTLSLVFEGVTKAPKKVTVNGQTVQGRIEGSAFVVDAPQGPVSQALEVIVTK